MIKEFVERHMADRPRLEALFSAQMPNNYLSIVKEVVRGLGWTEGRPCGFPDPNGVHEINDGSYSGTLVYVVGEGGYCPSDYWYAKVEYGTCSGCDTLERIRSYGDWDDDDNELPPNPRQVADLMVLALRVVQGLKKMGDDDEQG